MATFQQIYVNLSIGVGTAIVSFALFGLAVRKGYTDELAPRSWSRPRALVKNVLLNSNSSNNNCNHNNSNRENNSNINQDHTNRNLLFLGCSWIPWSWRLTYPDMLGGIPGTGTRNNGWAGPTLKVNLDGIIMLKYHALLSRVAILVTILCTLIVLPINVSTTQCDPEFFGEGTCQTIQNLTDFQRTTIANIPSLYFNGTTPTITLSKGSKKKNDESATNGDDTDSSRNQNDDEEDLSEGGTLARYFGIAMVSWVIYWYICRLLWKEWIDNLGLRRAFFLEYDHYKERREELNEFAQLKSIPEDPLHKTRPPWLPHPELRETIPNISLYTCLYQLPSRIETSLPDTASDLERKLSAAVDFFDQCIPTHPGFSSSVAAITILPKPRIVAEAWKKWYHCMKKLRQLRFIRQRIQVLVDRKDDKEEELIVFDKESSSGKENPEKDNIVVTSTEVDPVAVSRDKSSIMRSSSSTSDLGEAVTTSVEQGELEALSSSTSHDPEQSHEIPSPDVDSLVCKDTYIESVADPLDESGHPVNNNQSQSRIESIQPAFSSTNSQAETFMYANLDIEQCATDLGFKEEVTLGNLLSGIGIEQLSVYAREYAQCSASVFPYGYVSESLVNLMSLRELRAAEKEAVERVREANEELMAARSAVYLQCSGGCAVPYGFEEERMYDPATSKKEKEPTSLSGKDGHRSNDGDSKSKSKVRHRPTSSTPKTWVKAQSISRDISLAHRDIEKETGLFPTWERKPYGISNTLSPEAAVQRESMIVDNSSIHRKKSHILHSKDPTYAVVTFTFRQAAVAARQCLADGSGVDNWTETKELPVPPLADAPPRDLMFCRGCCRPVTLTIHKREQKVRRILGVSFFLIFCFFYTLPLTLVSHLLNPDSLAELFPGWDSLRNEESFFYTMMAGLSSGLMYSLFFSICPQLFMAIANFEGNVSSQRTSEDKALQYFWYFMMLAAFSGTSLAQMGIAVFFDEGQLGREIKDVLVAVANSIPTHQAPVWVNWLIVRFTYTLPVMYLLQATTFTFRFLGWRWCGRLMRGGGPGGPPPYRIYVDAGTVNMCLVAIAPVCPLIAPLALIYLLTMQLLLRWLLIFVYRPSYDAGGNKWPALHDIIISSTIFGQILVATILGLRNAYIPMIMVATAIVPTWMFSQNCKQRFLQAYNDAGLWQTSHLDRFMAVVDGTRSTSSQSLNTTATPSERQFRLAPTHSREEYRRWLVDCHKASYVPICLAGTDSVLTMEHAKVVAVVTPTTTTSTRTTIHPTNSSGDD